MTEKAVEKHEFVFRCFAYPERQGSRLGYTAVCIDLSLVTWREDLVSARNSLDDAVAGYVQAAVKELSKREEVSNSDFQKMFFRPVGFWPYRAKYYFVRFLWSLNRSRFALFDNPVLVPA